MQTGGEPETRRKRAGSPRGKWLAPGPVVTAGLAIAGGVATLTRVLRTMNTNKTRLQDKTDRIQTSIDRLGPQIGDVKALIVDLHTSAHDREIPGALAISAVNAKPGQLVDVSASRAGTVSKVETALDDIHFNRPNDGKREFVTPEIRHNDGTVMMYSRLTAASRGTVKEGMAVAEGQTTGQAEAFSPVCLRVCLKYSESSSCLDPRSLFPETPFGKA